MGEREKLVPLSLKEMGYEGRWQFRGGLIRDL